MSQQDDTDKPKKKNKRTRKPAVNRDDIFSDRRIADDRRITQPSSGKRESGKDKREKPIDRRKSQSGVRQDEWWLRVDYKDREL